MKLLVFGIILTLVSWIFAWGKISVLSQYTFFPIWLGYILTINGLSQVLLRKSLISGLGLKFILLFFLSIPLWWLFEMLNSVTQNWTYLLTTPASPTAYFLGGSVNFSIVIPAILSTFYLFYHLMLKIKPLTGKPSSITPFILFVSLVLGILFLLLILLLPNLYFPLLWGGIFFLLEPINYLFKFPSLFQKISQGNWTFVAAIMTAAIFTGFWWELWNFYSFPKWVYSIPDVGFFKIFEMPILGYLGYPFFGLEVYSFTSFSFGILRKIADNLKSLP